MMKTCRWSVIGLLVIVLSVWGFVGSSEGAKKIVIVGTAPPGAISFPYFVGVSTIVNNTVPGLALSTQVTGGSVANVRLIHEKKIQMAICGCLAASAAIVGKKPFKEKKNFKAAFTMYRQRFLYPTRKATGITSWDQLEGKTIAVGTAGGSTRMTGDAIVAAKGLKNKAKIRYLKSPAMAQALRDGTIQMGWVTDAAGSPSPVTQELLSTIDLTFVILDAATVKKVAKNVTGLEVAKVEKGWIKGGYGPQGNPPFITLSESMLSVVNADEDEQTVYLIVKTLIEKFGELPKYWAGAKNLKVEDLVTKPPANISYHPGAIRAFKEKGLMK